MTAAVNGHPDSGEQHCDRKPDRTRNCSSRTKIRKSAGALSPATILQPFQLVRCFFPFLTFIPGLIRRNRRGTSLKGFLTDDLLANIPRR